MVVVWSLFGLSFILSSFGTWCICKMEDDSDKWTVYAFWSKLISLVFLVPFFILLASEMVK